jgi:hypothetical protein
VQGIDSRLVGQLLKAKAPKFGDPFRNIANKSRFITFATMRYSSQKWTVCLNE